jgi:hypothetical protein
MHPMEIAMSQYSYTIKNKNTSSERLGNCEVCGKHVSEVFHQMEKRQFDGVNGRGWTCYGCHDYFGHYDCLIAQRREEATA